MGVMSDRGGGLLCGCDAGHPQRDVRTPAVMNGRQTGGTISANNIQMEAWNGRTHELTLNDVILYVSTAPPTTRKKFFERRTHHATHHHQFKLSYGGPHLSVLSKPSPIQ
eukprot:scaffold196586_cov44-Attheya_sp.AAC.2